MNDLIPHTVSRIACFSDSAWLVSVAVKSWSESDNSPSSQNHWPVSGPDHHQSLSPFQHHCPVRSVNQICLELDVTQQGSGQSIGEGLHTEVGHVELQQGSGR